jgi:hypothetical protein
MRVYFQGRVTFSGFALVRKTGCGADFAFGLVPRIRKLQKINSFSMLQTIQPFHVVIVVAVWKYFEGGRCYPSEICFSHCSLIWFVKSRDMSEEINLW